MIAGARLSTSNATMPRWLAGSKYSNVMHSMCTHTTLMFLKIQRKQPFIVAKEGNSNYFFQKAEDISHINDQYVPLELYLNADGSDPFLSEYDKDLLKQIEEREAHGAVKDACRGPILGYPKRS